MSKWGKTKRGGEEEKFHPSFAEGKTAGGAPFHVLENADEGRKKRNLHFWGGGGNSTQKPMLCTAQSSLK